MQHKSQEYTTSSSFFSVIQMRISKFLHWMKAKLVYQEHSLPRKTVHYTTLTKYFSIYCEDYGPCMFSLKLKKHRVRLFRFPCLNGVTSDDADIRCDITRKLETVTRLSETFLQFRLWIHCAGIGRHFGFFEKTTSSIMRYIPKIPAFYIIRQEDI